MCYNNKLYHQEVNMPFVKIDEKGTYTRFPGFTVIASVGAEESKLWEAIYNSIANNSVVRKYYAPLPASSYHMTAMGLFTQQYDGGTDWEGFIKAKMPFFKRLHEALHEREFKPEISFVEVNTSSTIHIVVSLPKEQQDIINDIAKEFDMESNVPFAFHITLAYQYEMIDEASIGEVRLELTKVRDAINTILAAKTSPLVIEPPKLTYFNDMTAFIPWDGKTSPFTTTSLWTAFFKALRLTAPDDDSPPRPRVNR